jgi:transposase-like protein
VNHLPAAPRFHNEKAAYAFCQSRLWPGGPVCPHSRCPGGKIGKLKGKSTRLGTYKCYGCRRPFTVKVGTVFESSHLKLHLWLQAIYLVSFTSRKITVRQLQQTLGIARKTASVLNRRIRELIARDDGPLAIVGDHRSAAVGETLASAKTLKVDRERTKPAGSGSSPTVERPEAKGSKSDAKRDSRKRRSNRRPRQPDPKQLTLNLSNQCR